MTCTRCDGSGFLNLHQCPEEIHGDIEKVLLWIKDNTEHNVSVCDCCGNCESWYGTPGEHYTSEDPRGFDGPYKYNGGLCQCH